MIYAFLSGLIMAGCMVIALLFRRAWRRTGDPLVQSFSFAFWILSVERCLLGLSGASVELLPRIYMLRLLAFGTILFAILWKNQRATH